MKNILFTVQSARRPFNVKKMTSAFKEFDLVWFVPKNEVQDYEKEGAFKVIGVEGQLPMKSKQLNAAMDYGFANYDYVITSDDDIVSFKEVYFNEENKKRCKKIDSIVPCIEEGIKIMEKENKFLLGFPLTTNPLFSKVGYKPYGAIAGSFFIHRNNELRFDESVKCLEDVDFFINHHLNNKGLIFFDKYFITYEMEGKNKIKGGYEGLRGKDVYKEFFENLVKKYDVVSEFIKFDFENKRKHSGNKVETDMPSFKIDYKKISIR